MTKLKLVKDKESEEKPSSNFWNCCPRKLDYLPEEECPKGMPCKGSEPECSWWINSKKHNYCFWKYVMDNSSPDGSMPELTQAELSKLFNLSGSQTHLLLKEAQTKLLKILKEKGFDLDQESIDELFSFSKPSTTEESSDF